MIKRVIFSLLIITGLSFAQNDKVPSIDTTNIERHWQLGIATEADEDNHWFKIGPSIQYSNNRLTIQSQLLQQNAKHKTLASSILFAF